MRIAIIGGTAAGPAAAAEARRIHPGAEIVLFEERPHVSVAVCDLPYYVGGRIAEASGLEVLTPRQLEREKGVRVRERHRVTALHPRERRLVVEALDFGSVHEEAFDRFILATGARARRLGIEGEEAPNVFVLRSLEDATGLRDYVEAHRVGHAVLVGGGYIGLEVAEALAGRGVRVTILEPKGRVLPEALAGEMAGPLQEAVRKAGVTVRAEAAVRFHTGRDGRVAAVHTDRREVIGCDLVLVAIGAEPRTELAEAAGLRLGRTGALAVDAGMRTSAPNVWACGDGVELRRHPDGAAVHFPLATVGRRGARVAARNAASVGRGQVATFAPFTPVIGVRAFGFEAARVGLALEGARQAGIDAVAAQIRHVSRSQLWPEAQVLDVRLIAERGSGRLLGGELLGREGAALRANVLVPLLRAGFTARQVVEEVDLLYNPPVAPAVDPLLIAASAVARRAGERRV